MWILLKKGKPWLCCMRVLYALYECVVSVVVLHMYIYYLRYLHFWKNDKHNTHKSLMTTADERFALAPRFFDKCQMSSNNVITTQQIINKRTKEQTSKRNEQTTGDGENEVYIAWKCWWLWRVQDFRLAWGDVGDCVLRKGWLK